MAKVTRASCSSLGVSVAGGRALSCVSLDAADGAGGGAAASVCVVASGDAGSADVSASRVAVALAADCVPVERVDPLDASDAEEGAGAGGGGGGAAAADERLASARDALPPSAPEDEAVEVLGGGGGGGGGAARFDVERLAEPVAPPDAVPDVVEGVEVDELTALEGRLVLVAVLDGVVGTEGLLPEALAAEEVAEEDEAVPRLLLGGLGAAVRGAASGALAVEAEVLPLVGARSAGGGGGGGATRAAVDGALLLLRPVVVLDIELGAARGALGRSATGGLGGTSLPRAVWLVGRLSVGGCGLSCAGRAAMTGGGICGVGRTA